MKKLNLKFGMINPYRLMSVFVLAGMVLLTFTRCDNGDEGEEENPLVGVYKISSATMAEDTPDSIKVAENTKKIFKEGEDVLQVVGSAFAGAASCQDPTNTSINLLDNFDFAYVCQGEGGDPTVAGTWNDNPEVKTVSINLNSTSFGVPITVKVVNYQITGNSLTGTVEGFPFPTDLTTDGSNPVFVDIDVTFTKIE